MTAKEDAERMALIEADTIAKAIHDAIDALPHARRLYPDTYALEVAAAVRAVVTIAEECSMCEGSGQVEDPTACGDPEHCYPTYDCRVCYGTGYVVG